MPELCEGRDPSRDNSGYGSTGLPDNLRKLDVRSFFVLLRRRSHEQCYGLILPDYNGLSYEFHIFNGEHPTSNKRLILPLYRQASIMRGIVQSPLYVPAKPRTLCIHPFTIYSSDAAHYKQCHFSSWLLLPLLSCCTRRGALSLPAEPAKRVCGLFHRSEDEP